MSEFKLDQRLKNDCFILDESENFILLLLNNTLVPWFILVPKTDKTELYELDESLQQQIICLINQISIFIKQEYPVDKLNIATIGNIVEQLHIHVIGRFKNDPYWPGVVWGREPKEPYAQKSVNIIQKQLKAILEI